ncbi:MAG: hypothetical protein V4508_23550 [Pseudomonadota bacterium]
MTVKRTLQLCAAGALVAALVGCGGGGSPDVAQAPLPVPPVVPPASSALQLTSDSNVDAGKTAAATVLAASGSLADISWSQVSGPAVTLLDARSPTVAFETATPGVVRLKADAILADGSSASATTDIMVGAAPAGSFITLRADHSVRPDTDTSIRAWPTLASGDTVTSIAWTQLDGPLVTMNTDDRQLLMFKSPKVSVDAVLRFRALMTTSSGRQDSDTVMVSVEHQAATPNGYIFASTARVHPYRQASAYAGVLVKCAYDVSLYFLDSTRNSLCPANTLPLLQTEAGPGAIPSVAQVMGRVLVSQDFLGANFEQFLLTQDPQGDFRRLLAGTAAVVIGSHVRPSFYTPATGAIYLDANNLWLSAEQRDVVTEVPDYRLAYADPLNYSGFGRLVRNNAYARRSVPVGTRGARSIDELVLELGRLLYHELGHASDYFEPSDRVLDGSKSIWMNVSPLVGFKGLPSDALARQYPLTSTEMKGLGQVLFEGATANAVQRAYLATDVGRFFAADVASDDYAYAINGDSSSREDLAMLYEEFMMSYRHGVQYDIAFTDKYVDGNSSGKVIVGWGERGRIAEPRIKPRIKLVLARIAPWIDPAEVDKLPAPILMTPGASWDDNLVLGTLARQSMRQQDGASVDRVQRAREDLRKPLHAR